MPQELTQRIRIVESRPEAATGASNSLVPNQSRSTDGDPESGGDAESDHRKEQPLRSRSRVADEPPC